ncbi:MAG: SGNH/GDSL hydrolase family protein [Pelobium sp.]
MNKRQIFTILCTMFIYSSSFAQVPSDAAKKKTDSLRWAQQEFQFHNDWANLKRFEEENNKLTLPKKYEIRVVLMGNSITQGWSDMHPDFFKDKAYINRGIGGQTTPQMLIRFRPDVINLKPKVVVILAGTNDIAGNTGKTSEETIVENIQSMALLAQHYGIKVVLSSILPVYDYPWKKGLNPVPKIKYINSQLKEFASKNKMVYLDYFTAMADERMGLKLELTYDGVHPNLMGYQTMEPLLEKAIQAALKK